MMTLFDVHVPILTLLRVRCDLLRTSWVSPIMKRAKPLEPTTPLPNAKLGTSAEVQMGLAEAQATLTASINESCGGMVEHLARTLR